MDRVSDRSPRRRLDRGVSWDVDLEKRLRHRWTLPRPAEKPAPTAVSLGEKGFLAEVAGKVILTAPARKLAIADDLPEGMREKWEKASAANPFFSWIQGRYVESGRANTNGAYWSTQDLQVGELSVRNGPLNWLHDATTVIGTIADNKLIMPSVVPQIASTVTTTADALLSSVTNSEMIVNHHPIETAVSAPRPYIAAVSAIWRWVHPTYARAVEAASDNGTLWYSMECVSREVACESDGDRTGCGASFPYLKAMADPTSTCEHIRNRTCARRMVDPAFLGGAVIVPPVRPGWSDASAEVMRQAAALAESVAPADAVTSEWEHLLAAVMQYAGT